jgi:outer membrane protein assembly factor BamB
VNGPAIDRDGVTYINAEDGALYAVAPGGTIRDSIMLTEALGQAYTPVAIDDNGRVYAEKAGTLFVVRGVAPERRRAVRR